MKYICLDCELELESTFEHLPKQSCGCKHTWGRPPNLEPAAPKATMSLRTGRKGSSPLVSHLKQEVERRLPHLIVEARAGTGKTTTLVWGVLNMFRNRCPAIWETLKSKIGFDPQPSPQQAKVWEAMALSCDAKTIQFTAFNKSIVREFEDKWGWAIQELRALGVSLSFNTNHSMGFAAVRKAFPRLEVSEYRVMDLIAELLHKDIRELRKNQFEMLKGTERLVGLCKMNLLDGTNADKLQALVSHHDLDIDGWRNEVFDLVPKVISLCKDPSKDRRIDFDDMVWLPVVHKLNLVKNDLLLVDEAQDLNRCQQALAKMAGHRLAFVGDEHQCFIPGTLVTLEGGRKVAIENLTYGLERGFRVLTFNPNGSNFSGRRTQGRQIEDYLCSDYSGEMIEIETAGNKVVCTPNHKWWARFDPSTSNKHCLYLMGKGNQYRIGICRMKYSCGIGVAARARSEGADMAWILQIFDSAIEARLAEELVSVKDGLPQLMFKNDGDAAADQEFLDSFYENLGDNSARAEQCLKDYGRDIRYPLWKKQDVEGEQFNYLSTVKGFTILACNLIDECFQLRVDDNTKEGKWKTANIGTVEYSGKVYGITVEPTERNLRLYVANNLVTHNSIYGFAGADTEALPRLRRELIATKQGCDLLPLTMTRRCGKAIVKEANKLVQDFQAYEGNPEGEVLEALYPTYEKDGRTIERKFEDTYMAKVGDGDMILCRVNAPLVSQCFRFLKRGVKANIQGRDVGAGLISTIQKLGAESISELLFKVGNWLEVESTRERSKRNPSESRVIALQDRHDCILAFTEGAREVMDVIKRIESIFVDDRKREGVRLSSIHKAKGLEAQRVFILQPKGASMPHPMAKSQWQLGQEYNLLYVAITRAVSQLYFVS